MAELAVADKSLMQPLKNNARVWLNADFLESCVQSDNGPRATLAIRMVREFPDEPGLYEKMRSHFIGISTTDGYWPRQQKTYLSSALPYFSEFDGDDEVKAQMISYWEETRREMCETSLQYFGGEDNWPVTRKR